LVWTAGTVPNPLTVALPCANEQGRIRVNEFLRVPDWPDVWAVGDCAFVPDVRNPGKSHPPTAQHAIREGEVVAQNIAAALVGRPLKSFSFKTIGLLASIGGRTGVARIFGFNFSGFFAWWLWRTVLPEQVARFRQKDSCGIWLDTGSSLPEGRLRSIWPRPRRSQFPLAGPGQKHDQKWRRLPIRAQLARWSLYQWRFSKGLARRAATSRSTSPTVITRRGYNVFFWTNNGMKYWAVSDLNQAELREFTELVRAVK